jgi:hypothetical protein
VGERSHLTLHNRRTGADIPIRHDLSPREARILLAGGLLQQIKGQVADQ